MKNGGQAHARPVVGGEPCPGCGPHAAGGYGSAFVLVVLLVLFARAVPVWAAPPQITSATAFTVDEGSTAVTTLTATDPENDPLTWSIPAGGGADADAFSLTAAGVLTFTAAPDYEASTDDDEDNVYAVTVEVSDGTNATPPPSQSQSRMSRRGSPARRPLATPRASAVSESRLTASMTTSPGR